MRTSRIALLAIGLASCGGAALELVEPLSSPDVRVVVTFTGSEAAATALAGSAPFRLVLGPERTEVWVLAYSSTQLSASFPSLAGKRAEEIAAALDPRFDQPGGLALPETSAVVSAEVSKASGAEPYRARDWASWVAASGGRLALHIAGETGPADPCAGIASEEIAMPMGIVAANAVWLTETAALAAGPWTVGEESLPMQLARVEGTHVSPLSIMDGPQGRPGGLAPDGGGFAYVVSTYVNGAPTNLFRVDGAGHRLRVPQLDLDDVYTGVDGTMAGRKGSRLYRWTRGSTAAVEWGAFNREMHVFAYASASRAVATDGPSIYAWDGRSWRREYDLMGTYLVSAFGANAEMLVAGGPYELVLRRDDATGTWEQLPKPFDGGHHARAIAPLSNGRFALAANRSGLAVWMGTRWCRVPIAPNTGFISLNASPSGKTLLAAGVDEFNTPGSRPALMRVTLP